MLFTKEQIDKIALDKYPVKINRTSMLLLKIPTDKNFRDRKKFKEGFRHAVKLVERQVVGELVKEERTSTEVK